MLAPAGYESDQCFQVPRVIDEHYPDRLLAICKENDVRVIIPTIDTELLVLAKYKEIWKAQGIDIIVSDFNFGGGYPLSYYAKANFPQYLIREYCLNEELEYSQNWLDNTLMLRYDSEVIVYEKA